MLNKAALNLSALKSSPLPGAVALVLLFVALALWPQSVAILGYQRVAIAHGQLWRVFSGHFVHLNLAHALLNSTGTLMLAFFMRRDITARDWWTVTLLAPFVISFGLWFKQPQLMGYVGFSGVLHGLLYFSIIRVWPKMPVTASLALLLLAGRQIWEQTSAYDPAYLRSLIGGLVMPDAHLFGALTGSALGLWSLWRSRGGAAH
jgi:rhomboid family GlyGly-CTERM serine protease